MAANKDGELTRVASGSLGISQAAATDICALNPLGKGRWRVWGNFRHTLADGVRLCQGPVAGPTTLATFPSAANTNGTFGPIVVDMNNGTDALILELAVATGGSDSASGILYAQRLSPI